MDSTATASSTGTPTAELKRNFDDVGAKRISNPRANGTPLTAVGSLKQNSNMQVGSKLRRVD
jgi:hypothetical protein